MKKLMILVLPFVLLSTGCTNVVEEQKNYYLTYKSNLTTKEDLNNTNELEFSTNFNLQRTSEKTDYSLVISDPKIDMYDVKALLIHDFMIDDVFPSVGIFDEPVKLLAQSNDKIILNGSINSDKDIENIKFRLYLEYKDQNDLINAVYYEINR